MERRIYILLCCIGTIGACVKGREFDPPERACLTDLGTTTTYAEVKDRYLGTTVQIQEDLIIEGYVISSDEKGNFFNELYIQNSPSNPTAGFQIELDLRNTHLRYPVGSKLYVKLKGLYLGKRKDVFQLGGSFEAFGNISVGRLPATVIDNHLVPACSEALILEPQELTIGALSPDLTNTLIKLCKVQIDDEELGQPFAIPKEVTERTLVDCQNQNVALLNSGFSDFQSEELPVGNGSIIGVLRREREAFKLVIRTLEDIDFGPLRCEDITATTARGMMISELADPVNNAKARFLELYNASEFPIDLQGWTVRRYTNESTMVGSVIDLSEQRIASKSTLVLAPNSDEFEAVYGLPPDMVVGVNSAADSNGDDTLELVDPFGTVIDIFGVVGEDGTGTNHEFENGRALRNPEVLQGNPVYDPNEWTVYNDSGGSGTIQEPQSAPEDFTPGNRN